jgi:tetratricopeptide (TPR) repeat protein
MTNDDGHPIAILLDLIERASVRVPVVKYAFGLVGIAACGVIIAAILGPHRSAVIILGLTFVGAILLFLFARLSASSSASVQSAGAFLIWVIVAFFSSFLLLTTTAFTWFWPEPWCEFLGICIQQNKSALCNDKIRVMFTMLNSQNNQLTDAAREADEVEKCDPFQAETVKGSVAFYQGNYVDAVTHFEKAHKLLPNDDPITRDLGDSYLEVGRYDDSLNAYNKISAQDQLWYYKIARANFYKGNYDVALSSIKNVPSDLADDGNLLGRPRVLEAAILVEQSNNAAGAGKNTLFGEAIKNFKEGVELDRDSWQKIFKITHRTKYERFLKEIETLSPYMDQWLAHASVKP